MANKILWEVVVAQLVERSLPIPEVRGLNPVISKILFINIKQLYTINCVLKRRKLIKRGQELPIVLKKHFSIFKFYGNLDFHGKGFKHFWTRIVGKGRLWVT